MGRIPRVHYDGAVYHAWARGVDRRAIFIDDADRRIFLSALKRIENEVSAEVIAYCLMGNHFHLAVRVGSVPLSAMMQRLLTAYALSFNGRHERTGHLFESRHSEKLCESDAYLNQLIHYIRMNPVRAGLVARPEDWPWTSPSAGNGPALPDMTGFDPWPREATRECELVRYEKVVSMDLPEIAEDILVRTGIARLELCSDVRRRPVVDAKRLFTKEAIRSGHSLTAVADWLNSSSASISRYARENTANTGKPDTP